MSEHQALEPVYTGLKSAIKQKLEAMPHGFNETRFIQNALSAIREIKDIENVSHESIIRGLLKGAFLDLDFFTKECYLITYNQNIGTKENPKYIKEVSFQTDYKGERKLALKYSFRKIKDICAYVVRQGDEFTWHIEKSGETSFEFKPKAFNDGEIVGAFAYAIFEDGTIKLTQPMSRKEIEEIRDAYSKAPDSKMWQKSFGEACKKTASRRLCKELDLRFENEEQTMAYKEGAGSNIDTEKRQIIDVEIPKSMQDDEIKLKLENLKKTGVVMSASEIKVKKC
jgi:recombination protein RecT